MRTTGRAFRAVFLFTALISGTYSIAHAQESFHLKRVYKAGEVDRYLMEMTTQMPSPQGGSSNMQMKTHMVMSSNTKSVDQNGDATIQISFSDFTISMNGNEMNPPTGMLPVVTFKVDPYGHVLSQKIEGGNPMMQNQQFQNSQSMEFPHHAIKIGDSWKINYTDPTKKTTVVGTITLAGRGEQQGINTLKLKTNADVTTEAMGHTIKMHIDGTAYVDPSNGKLIKAENEMTGVPGLPSGAPMTMTMTLLGKNEQ
ncbi:MAG: hypothetical protein M1330_04260 [Armatimonadetes bacterium]|nr:hypothetical protein [Armatimonadota bacterium]